MRAGLLFPFRYRQFIDGADLRCCVGGTLTLEPCVTPNTRYAQEAVAQLVTSMPNTPVNTILTEETISEILAFQEDQTVVRRVATGGRVFEFSQNNVLPSSESARVCVARVSLTVELKLSAIVQPEPPVSQHPRCVSRIHFWPLLRLAVDPDIVRKADGWMLYARDIFRVSSSRRPTARFIAQRLLAANPVEVPRYYADLLLELRPQMAEGQDVTGGADGEEGESQEVTMGAEREEGEPQEVIMGAEREEGGGEEVIMGAEREEGRGEGERGEGRRGR